jgi:hypothetical protein
MSNLRIAELDFENIKKNLKDFLKTYKNADGDVVFSDYEFEGSSLSILVDLLAYNTHYNAYIANMLVNEMFLDSAVKRESAVSIAKHLGYVPNSVRNARALITFDVVDPVGYPPTLTLDRFTVFNTTINNIAYSFVNPDPITIEARNSQYTFTDIELVEGVPLEVSYLVINPGPSEKYNIPNENVDLTTLRITVQRSFNDTTTTSYTFTDDITETTPAANVYYVEENPQGRYDVFFGDGVLGRKLQPDNIVRLQYLVGNGANCNVSGTIQQIFRTTTTPGGGLTQGQIVATRNSFGGTDKENIDSIKFNAPKYFATYNRAVTASDYKAIIQKNFPLIESIAAWGGETNNPPKYGKVIISLKPYEGYTVSNLIKQQIQDTILSTRSVMAITPEFVEPEFIYVGINALVTYDQNIAARSEGLIRGTIDSVIRNYFSVNLQKFDQDFVYSRLISAIDAADTSVLGNITRLHIQKRLRPDIETQNIYINENSIKFNNPLHRNTFRSTAFNFSNNNRVMACRMIDVPNSSTSDTGQVSIVNFDESETVQANIGVLSYITGELTIPNFFFNGYSDVANDIRLNAEPTNLNIQAENNQILILDDTVQNTSILRSSGLRINTVKR